MVIATETALPEYKTGAYLRFEARGADLIACAVHTQTFTIYVHARVGCGLGKTVNFQVLAPGRAKTVRQIFTHAYPASG